MTSLPAPGVQDPLQHRGSAPAWAPARLTAGQHGQDPGTEHERAADERPLRTKPRGRPVQLDGLQTMAGEPMRAPPKGKPQLFFSTAVDVGLDFSEPSPTAAALPNPPRPSLPLPAEALQQRRLLPGGTGIKTDPAIARSVNQDTSASAALLPGGKTADFSPWTGHHPDDMLTAQLANNGIFAPNKAQIEIEIKNARNSLWANLKNKSGTSTLSTLFIAVLEKRQSCNRLAAPNTFKPPPRLTLRDSTREAWLHDLANPAVGLRRLSRTIPHGVTGKVLLEQCLNKNIPITRAMWLAKCVGINEMRAHKRKGQAGTITWVRGWTSSVEQFLDSIITAIGQQDWKSRITYALQLAAHLFKEHLLEEDHFIDWVLKSLDSCPSERLFLWLLIACIPDFWKCLITSRRRGKRLAESLLAHAEKLYNDEGGIRETPVLGLLESVIARVVNIRPASFLLPCNWETCSEVLQIFAQRQAHPETSRAIADLNIRNEQIIRPPRLRSSLSQHSSGRLYRLLDDVDYKGTIPVDELAFDCLELIPDHNRLVSAALQWASSLYRQGLHRVYLVTRLLRKWNQAGADICEGILRYLPELGSDRSKEPELVFRIIAELVRSKTFSLGRYLQWLIATGSLDEDQNVHGTTAWQLRLLTEVPLTGLSEQVVNLRSTLLRRTPYAVDMEVEQISSVEDAILEQMARSSTQCGVDIPKTLDMKLLSRTVHLETAAWLRQQVALTVDVIDCASMKNENIAATSSVCTLSPSVFDTVRCYLEEFGDLSILADVVGIAANSYDSHILSATADTICYHYKAFKVIGAFNSLFEKIITGYTAIRTIRLPERDLLLSISALSQLAHTNSQLTPLLDYDLSRYDQKNFIAACSPVSDTMIENATRSDPEDEIERILSSGNSMDQQTMHKVFSRIVSYLEERICQGNHPTENFSTWLYRLRNFEESSFHIVLTSWLYSVLTSHQQPLLSAALPVLVVTGCLTLAGFLEAIQDCMRRTQRNHPTESFCLAVQGLDRILPDDDPNDLVKHHYAYRFRVQQTSFCQGPNSGLLALIKEVFEMRTAISEPQCEKKFSRMLSTDRLLDVFRHVAITDPQRLSFLLEISRRGINQADLLDRIVDPLSSLELSRMSCEEQATTIFQHTDQLSVPFCQLKLQDLFISSSAAGQPIESIPTTFVNFLKSSHRLDHSCYLDVVTGLDPILTDLIQQHAEREILAHSSFLCDRAFIDNGGYCSEVPSSIRRYMDVIYATQTANTREPEALLLTSLVERIKGIAESLNRGKYLSTALGEAAMATNGSSITNLRSWLVVLLRLVVSQSPGLIAKADHQQQAAFMWALWNLYTHPQLDDFPGTAQYLFDTAVFLSDFISEEARKHLTHVVNPKCSTDLRCTFIFGEKVQHDGWLVLTKSSSQSAVSQASAPLHGHSQAARSTQSQIPSQQPFNTGAMLAQRSSSQPQYHQQLHSQTQGRTFSQSQHQQSHKILSQQFQRMGSNGQSSTGTRLQQMQAMAQQRQAPTIGRQMQRVSSIESQSSTAAKSQVTRQERNETKFAAYNLNRWEILPENGGSAGGNETAIDLNLFGARKA